MEWNVWKLSFVNPQKMHIWGILTQRNETKKKQKIFYFTILGVVWQITTLSPFECGDWFLDHLNLNPRCFIDTKIILELIFFY